MRDDTELLKITLERLAKLDTMRDIASDTIPLTDALLNDFAAGVDKVFFRSSLMPRIKIRLSDEGVLYKQGDLGYTAFTERSSEYQQVHRAEIRLDPIREPSDLSDAGYRKKLLGVLVHELCHAYIGIFVERGTLFVEDALRTLGVDGHGAAFAELFESIASVLRNHKVVDLSLQLHLTWMVKEDQEKQDKLFSLGSKFELHGLADDEKEDMLVKQLEISREKASTFPQLLREGYTTLEAIVKLSWLVWDGDWRSQMKGLLHLDGDVGEEWSVYAQYCSLIVVDI